VHSSWSVGPSIPVGPAYRRPSRDTYSSQQLSFEHAARFSGKLRSTWAAECFPAQDVSGVSFGEI